MPDPTEEMNRLIKEARAEVAKDSALVALCQRRQDKFRVKYQHAARQVKRYAHKPRRLAFCQRRKARAKRKVRLWHQREIDAIELTRNWKAALKRRIAKKRRLAGGKARELMDWERSKVGVVEYSAQHREWASDLGYSAALPWCSIFQGYGIKHVESLSLPANPAYSGAWMAWSGGHRVNQSEVSQGDLLIFDWGDGGLTDHVAAYDGGGIKIGGNENNRVERDAVPWGNVVAIIRPEVH